VGDVVRSWYTLVELPAAAALSGVIWDKFRHVELSPSVSAVLMLAKLPKGVMLCGLEDRSGPEMW